ncbi:hypothetical protein Acid345_0782 [Candidatus Koribacter versatilis Ellin345]|uniref:RING-type domain-containing protein n=1 Tax=Koribacter versatilis (strain Ellin345) TaxID=204669 RepID=Q1ITL3_KORVE|nr:hypothetical protein Acid345_0782 [Candidatus Koribacter versatilis Ellin345]
MPALCFGPNCHENCGKMSTVPDRERDASTSVLDPETTHEGGADTCGPHIRCPLCRRKPREHSRWCCTCKHVWNTFDTGGVCPACLTHWSEPQCLTCRQWSAHSAWYAER